MGRPGSSAERTPRSAPSKDRESCWTSCNGRSRAGSGVRGLLVESSAEIGAGASVVRSGRVARGTRGSFELGAQRSDLLEQRSERSSAPPWCPELDRVPTRCRGERPFPLRRDRSEVLPIEASSCLLHPRTVETCWTARARKRPWRDSRSLGGPVPRSEDPISPIGHPPYEDPVVFVPELGVLEP